MSNKHLQVYISATTKEEADKILDTLLNKKLISGGLITNGPSRFWWKGKITETNYFNISSFTIQKHKKAIISEVKRMSIDELPIVWFIEIDGDNEFLKWIEENLS